MVRLVSNFSLPEQFYKASLLGSFSEYEVLRNILDDSSMKYSIQEQDDEPHYWHEQLVNPKCNGASVGVVSASYWKLIDAGLLPCNLIISPADASMDVTIFTQMEWRWLLLTTAIYQ